MTRVPGRLPALAGAAALALALSVPAAAQEDVTEDNTSVGDVAMTPLSDLNLRKDPIPPVLIEAHANPYDDTGLGGCPDIRREIGNLDAVLGEDFDTVIETDPDSSPEKMAQSVLGSLIPFRGLIRQISGANRHEWEFRQAIVAGLSRRAYLKGLGQATGCSYPARPAPPGMFVRPVGHEEETQVPDASPASEDGPVTQQQD